MDFSALKKLGLSENEIQIYVALLELGTSKVDGINKRVNFPRTTIYGLLKTLLEKGMVSYVIKGGVKYYESADPKRLLLIEEEKISELKKTIPLLESIKETVTEKPQIETYEGIKGIQTIYQDILETRQTIYGYGNTNIQIDLLPYYLKHFVTNRIEKKIKILVITEKSKDSIDLQKNDKKELRETRFLDSLKKMDTAIHIYGDKTAIMSLNKKEPIGIIIKNREITQGHKIVFDQLWQISKK